VPLIRVESYTFFIEFLGPPFGFSATSLSANYYGFKLYVIPVFSSASPSNVFFRNTATFGGGIYFYSSNVNSIILHANFTQNIGTTSGGGLSLGGSNAGTGIQKVSSVRGNRQHPICFIYRWPLYFSCDRRPFHQIQPLTKEGRCKWYSPTLGRRSENACFRLILLHCMEER
jgi:hypothetical protein